MTGWRPVLRCLLAVAVLAQVAGPAGAEPVTTILSNGPSANRVDVVVLGDGFTAAQVASGAYRSAVEAFFAGVFAQQPYREYLRAYNLHLVDVVSAQAGSDHPSRGIAVDTALDSTYDCSGIQRLICVSLTKVNAVIARSPIAGDAHDLVVVMVNDTEYGGSGGSVGVASLHASAVELILHEVGHTFALLADEYTTQPPTCVVSPEPAQANATAVTERAAIKWLPWIDPSTPVPTTNTTPGEPGLYLGARYCPAGLYRPTYDSKMRTLGRPFDQINTEQHVRRIYNLMSPIDAVSPPLTTTAVHQGDRFTVTPFPPASHALEVTWRVDGALAGTGAEFVTTAVPQGPHEITATVRDTTAMVRSDPAGLLSANARWMVVVGAPLTNTAPTLLTATAIVGHQVTIAWQAPAEGTPTGYVVEGGVAPGQVLASLPTGGTATTFSFAAPTGTFFIRVHALTGGTRSAPSNEIQIAVDVPAPPSAPTNLLGSANGSALALAWQNTSAGGAATGVRLDVSGPVTAALALPLGETFTFAGVPPGTYTFAVRATNAVGTSAASPPVTLSFPGACSPPLAPTGLSVGTSGVVVTASWQLPSSGAAPTGYLLLVSGAFSGVVPLSTRSIAAPAPAGTYTLSVVAIGSCGQSPPTPSQTVTVP